MVTGMKRKRRTKRGKHFVLGVDVRNDGHTRITKGEDYVVHGGTEASHAEVVDIVSTFSKKLAKEGDAGPKATAEILRDVMKKKGYVQAPGNDGARA